MNAPRFDDNKATFINSAIHSNFLYSPIQTLPSLSSSSSASCAKEMHNPNLTKKMSPAATAASFLFLLLFSILDAYDTMDPEGNITVKWDFMTSNADRYTIMVSIYNYQLYRHIESPGWRLGWTWPNDEVIWDMRGAEATDQGNCSRFKGDTLPHSCEKNPIIVDLPLGSPYNMQTSNCCKGGVLSSITQDPSFILSSFQMVIQSGNISDPATGKPSNFSLGVPGYTCSNATTVPPSKFKFDKQRTTQAQMTWQVICSYSQFRESVMPTCCVSLSAFYNSTIVSCPQCSCGCQGSPAAPRCLSVENQKAKLQQFVPAGSDAGLTAGPILCTQHMCPISVHWHVKVSYRKYWRVKMTITNYNMYKNYSDWNLVIQHPNLRSVAQVFSFNYQPLVQYGDINDTGMFWGIKYYNDMLLNNGEMGNVQSEMLLHKDVDDFTFSGGWPLPRRLLFNGHVCVMPPPDLYPSLPKRSSSGTPSVPHDLSLSSWILLSMLMLLL